MAEWDTTKTAFLAPLAEIPPLPEQYGLGADAPAWLSGITGNLGDWVEVPDPAEDPTFHDAAMVAAGLNPFDTQLPSWLSDLAGQVKAGQDALGTLDDSLQTYYADPITATNWSTLADTQEMYVGAIPDGNGKVLRIVGTQARLVDVALVNAELSTSAINGTRRTDADWDLWFAEHGSTAIVTQPAKDALASAIGVIVASLTTQLGQIGGQGSPTQVEQIKAAKASFEEAQRRCDATGFLDESPTLTYNQYVNLAKLLLGDGVGQSFADQFGLGGLQRLFDLTNAGWKIDTYVGLYTDEGTGLYLVAGDYQKSLTTRTLRINIVGPVGNGDYELLLNVQVALRVWDAIHDPEVTIGNTGFLGYDQFWNTTRVMGLLQAGFAVAQIAGSVTAAFATGGVGAVPAWYGVVSGLNAFQAGMDAFANDNPDARGFLHHTVDQVTGNQSATNGILFIADLGQGVLQSRALLQAKALANQQAAVAAVVNSAGDTTPELISAASSTVRSATEATRRSVLEAVATAETNSSNALSLRILNPDFTPEGAVVLQNLANRNNAILSQDLSVATQFLTDREMLAAAMNPRILRMQYGNALERFVAHDIEEDDLLRTIFRHSGQTPGASAPDFEGIGVLTGQIFDITTKRQALKHFKRRYGSSLQLIYYDRPNTIP